MNLFGKKKGTSKSSTKKLSKDEKKKIKERKKRAAKRQGLFRGATGFLNDDGYVEYDGYLKINHKDEEQPTKYMASYDLLFKYGTHNPAPYGWTNILIPTSILRHGDIYFALREKGMPKSVENETVGRNIRARQVTMENQKESSNVRESAKTEAELKDIQIAKEQSKEDNVTDSDMSLVIKSRTPEELEETLIELKQSYKDDGITGIMPIRKTDHQLNFIKDMFHDVYADPWHNSDMQSTAASRLFLPNSGFMDQFGTMTGVDIHSYLVNTPSIIDFNGIRNAVIMTGGVKGNVSIGGSEASSMVSRFGSAWAHVIADDNYIVQGHRTHHIVLKDFEYHAYDSKVFDMNKYTINALECWGTPETVESDANNNFDKVVEILMMLLEDDNPDPAIRALLYNQLMDWVINRANGNGMYTTDPKNEPLQARKILASQDHENYPTLQHFITELQSMTAGEAKKGEKAQERAELLLNSLRTASRRFPAVFNDVTDIPDTLTRNDRNIYYDLSKVGGREMIRGAIFLNVLAYVVNRATPNDLIVIHGIDDVKVNPKVLKPYRDKMDQKGIGLITTFEERENPDMNIRTLESFVHPLTNQDMVIIGGVNQTTEKLIQESWSRPLPATVAQDLEQNADGQFFVYRARDFGSAVIDTHLIL